MSGSVVAAVQRRYIRRFKEANAYDPKTAVSLDELGLKERLAFQRLVNSGVFRVTSNKKYYIDRDSLELFKERRRKILFVVLFISLIVMIWGIFYAK